MKHERYELRLTQEQKMAYSAAAKAVGISLAQWLIECANHRLLRNISKKMIGNHYSEPPKETATSKDSYRRFVDPGELLKK